MTTTAVEASSVEAQVQVFLKDGTEVKANGVCILKYFTYFHNIDNID